jgi:phospholipase C
MLEIPPGANSIVRTDTSRRTIIKGAAGFAGAAAITGSLPSAFATSDHHELPHPEDSGIDHIVVLMMENRSFDHMLGWVHGADGVQAGRVFKDTNGDDQQTFHLTKFQNCSSADPNHSFAGGRTQLNNGRMDGFLKTAKAGDTFPIGFYTEADVPFFASAARHWTICDHYHCSMLGPTWPNRFYLHSGQTDRLTTGGTTIDTGTTTSILPTIWDLAADANVSARYYFHDSAFTALWGSKYSSISFPFSQFQSDAATGSLPSISYVDPLFGGESLGTSQDDHPLADIRNGQVLMNTVYQTLSNSPDWARTLLIINYDEWGGFADHIAPEMAPVSAHEVTVGNVDSAVNADGTGSAYLGFRVPCILIGPRVRRGSVAHGQFDANSILNMITWRFNLPGLGVRSATSGNIATALDFSKRPELSLPPPIDLPNETFGSACADNPLADLEELNRSFAQHFADLGVIKSLMTMHGFKTT